MRAAHERGIQRDDVQQVTEAQERLQQCPSYLHFWGLEVWVKEEFYGIVTWLAVDVHRSGIVWCQAVVEPVVVGEPGIWLGNRHQFSRSRMIEMSFALPLIVQHLCNTRSGL